MKQLKEKAGMLEEDVEDLYQHAPCGYLSCILDGTIIKINQTALQWLGYALEEVQYEKRFQDLLPIGGRIFYQTHHFPLLKMQGFIKEISYDIIRKDGSVQPVLLNSHLVKDTKSEFAIMRITLFDITDRKVYEQELLKAKKQAELNQERFKVIAENLPGMVWTARDDGTIDFMNSRWKEFLRTLPKTTVPGISIWEQLIHPHEYPDMIQVWTEALVTKSPFKDEFRLRDIDGNYRWMLAKAFPYKDEEGGLKWFGTLVDIDEEKRAHDIIKESENQLRLVMNAAPVLIAYVDTEERYQMVNSAYTDYWAIAPEKIKGMTVRQFVGPQVYKKLGPHIKKVLKGKKAHFENEMLTPRYGSRVLSVSYTPNSFNGQIQGFVVLINDITDVKQFEKELERRVEERTQALSEANAELLRSNHDLEQFAYVASHDMKEPMRMVSIYTQLLQRHMAAHMDEKAEEYIGITTQAAHRLLHLLNNILEYSRIGRLNKEMEQFDAGEVISGVLHSFQPEIKERQVQVDIGEMPVISYIKTYFRQVMQHLILNAIKYCPDKSPHIIIQAVPQEGSWLFSVSDNGMGIGQIYHERIFQIFQRLHNKDQFSGTGIGLSIVKKIVELFGGQVWLESEEGQGATFYFTVPVEER